MSVPERDAADAALTRAAALLEEVSQLDMGRRDALKIELLLAEARMRAIREIDNDLAMVIVVLQSHGLDLVQILEQDPEEFAFDTVVTVKHGNDEFAERRRVDSLIEEAEHVLEQSIHLSDLDKLVWKLRLHTAKAEVHALRDLDDDVGHTVEMIVTHGATLGGAIRAYLNSHPPNSRSR